MPPQLRATQQFGHGNKGNGVSGGWNLGLRVARGGGALKRSAARATIDNSLLYLNTFAIVSN